MFPHFKSLRHASRWVALQRRSDECFAKLVPHLCTQDGLLPTREILVKKNGNFCLKREPRLRLYPHWRAEEVVEIILSDVALWGRAAIRVASRESLVGRAP